jgi:benzoyl-CoA reductase/2-hydroxyglutaryl-CoA dehydratase subunit BcrC/BadD/HgdB
MKSVGYTCPFVPREWIAAHGLRPVRFLPSNGNGTHGREGLSGVCPFAKATLDTVSRRTDLDAVVMTTTCDQMRRISELVPGARNAPLFLFHVPATWKRAPAFVFYQSELERLGRFLERLGGQKPTLDEIAEEMRKSGSLRSELVAAREHLSPRKFSEAIAEFHETGTADLSGSRNGDEGDRVPVALVGGPLSAGHFDIFDTIEDAGGSVVLDGTTSGERTLPRTFDPEKLGRDPVAALVDAYIGSIPDAFRRPNDGLYDWLDRTLRERRVRGIILRRYLWCDTWNAEAQRMREWSDLPLLALDVCDEDGDATRTANRIQAFLEALR